MRLPLADGLFWLSVASCLIAQLLIIRSVRGARHVPASGAGVPRHHGALEMVWALLPAVGLVVLLAFTWRAMRTAPGRAEPVHPSIRMGA